LFFFSYVRTMLGPFLPPAPDPSVFPSPPHFQSEPILPFSPILLKSRQKK
jgi:hypothetical protein